MSQLEKHGKGIILLHDFHRNTAEALPEFDPPTGGGAATRWCIWCRRES
jgi:hypothetical protein